MPSMSRKKRAIVIDAENKLIFNSETELYEHFEKEVDELESKFFKWRKESDIKESDFTKFENRLESTMENPDEIWSDSTDLIDSPVTIYIKVFDNEKTSELEYYIAITYLTLDVPSFIYLHFPSTDIDLVERYRSGELVYSNSLSDAPAGALEGDTLFEADEFAIGLYEAMMILRGDEDLKEDEFSSYGDFRETAIEEADEIWRRSDSMGNVLVTFVKDYSDSNDDPLWYIAVTMEDTPSNSHVLMFSFPTNDENLVDRYRQGENLQADEVIQEASH